MTCLCRFAGLALLASLSVALPAAAQTHQHSAAADTSAHGMPGMDMSNMDMSGMDMTHEHGAMTGQFGPYPMTREASGTSWQPDAAEHQGLHVVRGPWRLMVHGMADGVADRQGGPRGGDRFFGSNMLMGMAQRPLGAGTFGARTMLSIEPATIGRQGYPLLLQTGETADGETHLIDRQHPHDLFMELAASYSVARGANALFVYGGLPGEPALGPPAFMHRASGMSIPQAPITHHWLDSSHITFGVLTAGAVVDRVKFEASAFRGREPDESRWNLETPKLDSHAFRLSVNPRPEWAFQVSHGRMRSPEQLAPDVNQDRTTASAIHDGAWRGGRWEVTLAWGRNRSRPGHTLDALLAEGTAVLAERHTLFVRAERAAKDELFDEADPRAGRVFTVGALTGGYRADFFRAEHAAIGLGVAGTLSIVPAELRGVYGDTPASVLVFAHLALR